MRPLSKLIPPRLKNFNPRTPCGVRRKLTSTTRQTAQFQSTHPVRGATSSEPLGSGITRISIHAPRAGCDLKQSITPVEQLNFNPRTPCGVRPSQIGSAAGVEHFNPRTPCGVRQPPLRCKSDRDYHFNPRTPCGVRLISHVPAPYGLKFQSTHPVRGATPKSHTEHEFFLISIHAPRAGCDSKVTYRA